MSEHSSHDSSRSSDASSDNAPLHDPASSTVTNDGPALARTMGLGALIIYGVGDMLGAGVYSVIGRWAGTMGNALWMAFVASMVAALLTGLSYASLGSRYPRAAGASFITHRAFHKPFLSYIVGLAVVASGLTSFATQSRAFSGYFLGLIGQSLPGAESALPPANPLTVIAIILAFILALTFINFWGMRESTVLNLICTFVEVSGLIIVVIVGARFWGSVNYLEVPAAAQTSGSGVGGWFWPTFILQGAVLTFYSYVGFEDMINVTEEVKDPRRNFPIAVMVALGITTLVYIAISITAVSVVPYQALAKSGQPLVDVVTTAAPSFPREVFSFISLFAITNTALLNYIMGSRLIYGMARQGFLPQFLGSVHPARRTPHMAILALMLVVMVLAMSGSVGQLAAATSVLLLTVFIIINAALVVLKRRADEPKGSFEIPTFVPIGGILVCAMMLYHVKAPAATPTDPHPYDPRLIALALLLGIAALYAIVRPLFLRHPSCIGRCCTAGSAV
ncbi:MAG TPA: amino acid permease [Abditibacteriaceae bacterium]